ncbi:hypothetical protein DYB37_003227 [Aphanomyces astaci]|uniref:Uncharacterized protein n=1 Tax=Aphanomyces astaci TaxID=112090 RepID=A0A3R6WZ16_APHAT|nr:hypothetical protein DYB35_000460 [Aphanomyces astaci]RHZ03684.1 hypothetical protein DYB37_003227 [Aphanomyces astaci]
MRRVLIAAAKNGVAFPYEKDSSALVLSCPQVLESCATLKIPVELRSPILDEVDKWSGAFVTSTSRVLMPIQSFVYPARTEDGGSITREKTWASCSIVDRLHRHMFETVQSHSTKVFD